MSVHVPVMTDEVVAALQPERGGLFVDCTVGLGGHARALLERGATRLVGIDRTGRSLSLGLACAAAGGAEELPAEPRLLPNGPNPFCGATTLRFSLPPAMAGARTSLSVYDLQGRLRARPLAPVSCEPGDHAIDWRGCDARGRPLAAGVYYLRLQAGERILTRTITVAH